MPHLKEEDIKKLKDLPGVNFIMLDIVANRVVRDFPKDKYNEEFKKMLISKIPSGDLGTGEDVSNCVAFLASDMSNYINGETIHVNGGMYMS